MPSLDTWVPAALIAASLPIRRPFPRMVAGFRPAHAESGRAGPGPAAHHACGPGRRVPDPPVQRQRLRGDRARPLRRSAPGVEVPRAGAQGTRHKTRASPRPLDLVNRAEVRHVIPPGGSAGPTRRLSRPPCAGLDLGKPSVHVRPRSAYQFLAAGRDPCHIHRLAGEAHCSGCSTTSRARTRRSCTRALRRPSSLDSGVG